jgi:hypothetical protein
MSDQFEHEARRDPVDSGALEGAQRTKGYGGAEGKRGHAV